MVPFFRNNWLFLCHVIRITLSITFVVVVGMIPHRQYSFCMWQDDCQWAGNYMTLLCGTGPTSSSCWIYRCYHMMVSSEGQFQISSNESIYTIHSFFFGSNKQVKKQHYLDCQGNTIYEHVQSETQTHI